jgi:putative YhdH/YhfP family quinone oxidoreductase
MSNRALFAEKTEGGYRVDFRDLDDGDLRGDVLVDVAYSSLNYKDGLAITARGKIIRKFPMVLGIDLAGTVVESSSPDYKPGDRVVGLAHGLGETEWGGYAQRQRVRADVLVPLPDALSFEESMAIGTAGFTAMLCALALEQMDIRPSEREFVVTGAAGGVGSIAVMLLAKRGYKVAASTGRPELEDYLRSLGASSIVPREELSKKSAPLESERWGGGIDTVGGQTLATLFAQTAYGGAIACCGMAGGGELNTFVWPMILRNVSLLGVSSVQTPISQRRTAWAALAEEIDREKLAALSRVEPMSRIRDLAEEITSGSVRGRIVIDVNG